MGQTMRCAPFGRAWHFAACVCRPLVAPSFLNTSIQVKIRVCAHPAVVVVVVVWVWVWVGGEGSPRSPIDSGHAGLQVWHPLPI